MEDILRNKGMVISCSMVLLAGCLWGIGAYLGLKVTAVNSLVVAIGLCLMVASAFKVVT